MGFVCLSTFCLNPFGAFFGIANFSYKMDQNTLFPCLHCSTIVNSRFLLICLSLFIFSSFFFATNHSYFWSNHSISFRFRIILTWFEQSEYSSHTDFMNRKNKSFSNTWFWGTLKKIRHYVAKECYANLSNKIIDDKYCALNKHTNCNWTGTSVLNSNWLLIDNGWCVFSIRSFICTQFLVDAHFCMGRF